MAKTKLSQYDSTAANNTDINSINIAEGMAPSDVNNSFRELMSELKNFQTGASGDDLTVGGNFTPLGTLTANASVGSAGQVLSSRGAALSPQWVTSTYAAIGANGDITSLTALASVPTVVTTALNLKANLASPTFTGTPAAPTPTAGDNSTKLATTAYVDNQDIGVGQTWQAFTSPTRQLGTTYTNNTGKPIFVSVYLGSGPALGTTLTIGGVAVDSAFTSASVNNGVGGIVPNGTSYIINASGATVAFWAELR
jgi:hypothetical protein